MKTTTRSLLITVTALLGTASLLFAVHPTDNDTAMRSSYIVQGQDLDTLRSLVSAEGGNITHELRIINAVAADLTPDQLATLRAAPGIRRIYGNTAVEAAGKPNKDGGSDGGDSGDGSTAGSAYTDYPSLVDADVLHDQGIDGWGVGIAIVDSGIYSGPGLAHDRYLMKRIKAVYDATTGQQIFEGGRG